MATTKDDLKELKQTLQKKIDLVKKIQDCVSDYSVGLQFELTDESEELEHGFKNFSTEKLEWIKSKREESLKTLIRLAKTLEKNENFTGLTELSKQEQDEKLSEGRFF